MDRQIVDGNESLFPIPISEMEACVHKKTNTSVTIAAYTINKGWKHPKPFSQSVAKHTVGCCIMRSLQLSVF